MDTPLVFPRSIPNGLMVAKPLTGAQTSIIQNLSYFEHLAEPMAEFLHILSEQYDYPQLADEILRSVSLK